MAPTSPPLPRAARDGMLAELHALGLDSAGALVVVTLTALRKSLQGGGGKPLPSIRDALVSLDVGLQRDATGCGRADVARDCGDVAAWLEARGALRTACGYADAAAVLEPSDAHRALTAARLARRLRRMPEAVEWGVRAVHLAGRARDTDTRAAALLALAETAYSAQRYGEAERLFALARRYARSRGADERRGDALRGLALVRHAQERDEEALALVLDALAAYGGRAACVWVLACTMLTMWLDAGEYRGTLALGKLLLALPLSPGDELSVCALSARAAAALGWELYYESACLRAILALSLLPTHIPHGPALLDLARAHGSLGFWPRVVLSADRARSDAQLFGDAETAAVAQRMLDAAALGCIPDEVLADLFPDAETEEIPEGEDLPGWEPTGKAVSAFADALGVVA